MTKTLLITYFGPFPGVSVNPSGVTARQVADLLADESAVRVVTREVPVSYAGSSEALGEMLTDIRPDAVLSLGVAVGRDKVSFEKVAINLDSADIEDNDGVVRVDEAIAPDGREAYFSTLPVRASYERLRGVGLPVEISYTAGTYVCNHVFYEAHRILERQGRRIPAGFVHIPATQVDHESSDAQTTLTAHADAGGVESNSNSVPTLPEAVVARIVAELVRDTLKVM